MNQVLTAEMIAENWQMFLKVIDSTITGDRKTKLLDLYTELEEFAVLAPAAMATSNHNCIPGGYIDHVLRVYFAAKKIQKVWEEFQGVIDFTEEELAFVCLNHDLGKLGLPGHPGAFKNDNNWEVEKLGRTYKKNSELPFATVPDRGLFLLQSRGIPLTFNEYLGIKLHDGLYEDMNKPYLVSYQPESRLRSSLPLIVHQADLLAARVEWERDWYGKFTEPTVKKQTPPPASSTLKKQMPATQEALKRVAANNPSILNALKNI